MTSGQMHVSISAIAAEIVEPWQPVEVAAANGHVIRLAMLDGEFPWHHHDEDELFLGWSGKFRIELEGRSPVEIGAGDIFVVAAGTEHRPVATDGPAFALLLERPETRQYGNE